MTSFTDPIFLPTRAGVPAQNRIVFADNNNFIQLIDPSVRTDILDSFRGTWESPTLNREGQGFNWTLREITLWYHAEADSVLIVEASGDGGDTWRESLNLNVIRSIQEVRQINAVFNTTGDDLRYRLIMAQDEIIKVIGYEYAIQKRNLHRNIAAFEA